MTGSGDARMLGWRGAHIVRPAEASRFVSLRPNGIHVCLVAQTRRKKRTELGCRGWAPSGTAVLNDDPSPKRSRSRQQFRVEGDLPSRGTASPLPRHGAYVNFVYGGRTLIRRADASTSARNPTAHSLL